MMSNNVTFVSGAKKVHRNRPQIEIFAVMSRIMVLLWGRATGKTKGASGPLIYHYSTSMPGSVGALGCDSYKHLKKEILPELFKTWKEDFGLVKDRDYWVNRFPPKELEIPEAIRPVPEPDNCIFFRNGSVLKLFSFNFSALQNGDSIDYLVVEEGKLVKPERLNETILCVRGNDNVFGHMSIHKSIVIISDMPDYVKGMYLLDYEKQMKPDYVQLIKLLSIEISKLQIELDGGVTVRRGKQIEKTMEELDERRNFLRKYTVFVSYASTLENLHTLGMDVITNFRKTLSKEKFRLSVLGLKPTTIGDSFYNFSDRHSYVAIHADYVNKLMDKSNPDCRWDSDIDYSKPLEICLDYNAKITSVAVGQFHEGELKLLHTLHVDHPKRLKHALKKFHEYYKYLPNRVVNYYYDNTATGTDANRTEDETHRATVIDYLSDPELGWEVYDYRFSQTSHQDRYEWWSQCFEGDPEFPFTFSYNKENCRSWEYAAQHAPVIIKHVVDKGTKYTIIEKDKLSEKNKSIPPIQATHMTEAVDGLFVACRETYTTVKGGMLAIR